MGKCKVAISTFVVGGVLQHFPTQNYLGVENAPSLYLPTAVIPLILKIIFTITITFVFVLVFGCKAKATSPLAALGRGPVNVKMRSLGQISMPV